MIAEEVDRYFALAQERYLMLANRVAGVTCYKFGYTDDPILGQFRFCNVFREDDKVTKWVLRELRAPLEGDMPKTLRAMLVFRWFNLIESGECLRPWLLGYESRQDAIGKLHRRVAEKKPILNAAYMIKSPPGHDKITGLFQCIDAILPSIDSLAHTMHVNRSLRQAVELLCTFPYLGPFMAYQIVCDLRFTCVLDNAKDINTWTAAGPGSARGMSRLMYGRPDVFGYTSPKDKDTLIALMTDVLKMSKDKWPKKFQAWELSTVQHWACEYDKYMRALNGEGTPKQLYRRNP